MSVEFEKDFIAQQRVAPEKKSFALFLVRIGICKDTQTANIILLVIAGIFVLVTLFFITRIDRDYTVNYEDLPRETKLKIQQQAQQLNINP